MINWLRGDDRALGILTEGLELFNEEGNQGWTKDRYAGCRTLGSYAIVLCNIEPHGGIEE